MRPDRLSSFPYVVVRIGCAACKREGSYRLARLAEKFGAEAGLDDVLAQLASDCRARRLGVKLKKGERCQAEFVDLEPEPPPPPDLPPMMLRPKLVKDERHASEMTEGERVARRRRLKE